MINKTWPVPLLSTTLYYALFYLVSAWGFSVRIEPAAVPCDWALQVLFAYLLFALSRRVTVFLIAQGLVMGVLYVGNAVKIAFFGGPIVPDDAYALRSLLLILEGWDFLAVVVPLLGVLGLLLFNFTLRRRGAYPAFLSVTLVAVTLVYQPSLMLDPMDRYFGNVVWDQRSNYLYRGAGVYSLQEGARYFADAEPPPDRFAVQKAMQTLQGGFRRVRTPRSFQPRNVHVIVLESFWDPGVLAKAGLSRDALDEDFRKLWSAAGYSKAMSPVFGGYTANAEFEMLCGFPVVENGVKFERRLLNDVACLPRILAERGYATIASHPNIPVFWNRTNAYRRVGFETYWSKSSFALDDMNREFLGDSSLYRQVLEKISATLDSGRPVLNYVLTYFGHWDYPLNEARPALITAASTVREVAAYANTVYYKSRELMGFVDELRRLDPDGIIVAFGDHLPFLGGNFAGYVESGILAKSRDEFSDAMFGTYVSTPLLIIDGSRGPVQVGTVPLYEVPGLVLDLLGNDRTTLMEFSRAPAGRHVRPLPGMHFNLLEDGRIQVCRDANASGDCAASTRWLRDLLTIENDLFMGKQYARPPQPSAAVEVTAFGAPAYAQ